MAPEGSGAGRKDAEVLLSMEGDATPAAGDRALEAEISARLGALDLAAKVRLLSAQDHWSTHAAPAIGLRSIVVSDGPVGVRGVRWSEDETSANTPSTTAIASTFDPELAEEIGRLIGSEARRKGVDVVLAPTVNLQRTPYGGRHFEALSEDPLLTSSIAVAVVRGIQSQGPATTVKHFIANEAETDRLRSNSVVDERVLREVYLAPFEAVVRDADGLGLMCSYNAINGTLGSETPMLNSVVKGEWGFAGFVISDWGAVRGVEKSAGEGVDLVFPGPRTAWSMGLLESVRSGAVSEEAVDDKVVRLLRLAARVGALDGVAPLVDPGTLGTPPQPDAPAVRRLLVRASALGTVLLRNEGDVLPLDPATLTRIAVIGPAALNPRINGGGSAAVIAPYAAIPLHAIEQAFDQVEVVYAEGARPSTLVRPLSREFGRAPCGEGVVLVEFVDAHGETVGSQVRSHPDTLVYGMGHPVGVPEDQVAGYRVSTRITAPADGDYVLAGAGVGHARITVDGVLRVDEDLVGITDDAVVSMSMPPQALVELRLRSGQGVDVVFDFLPAPHTVAAPRLGFDAVAPDDDTLITQAADAASGADVALVLVGTSPEDESEGFDRSTLALGGRQDDLVRAVAAANARTVVVVNAGAPVLLPWRDDVAAILLPWFGGQEMGTSLADVLIGVAEPGGRLPMTWPANEGAPLASPRPVDGDVVYAEGLDVGYRAFRRAGVCPAYAFGHGLGYTSWALGEPAVEHIEDGLLVDVEVTNTGGRRGRQVVQAYCSRPDSSITRPVMWYAGSRVVELAPGEKTHATVRVLRRVLEDWDVDKQSWSLEPGALEVSVGTASDNLTPTTRVQLP